MKAPILVTGCARSGTSLVAGVLHLGGAWVGNYVGAHPLNPKGFFENRFIREQIVKPYLRDLGVDPLCQRDLPDAESLTPVPGWRDRVVEAIRSQNYEDGPWLYKGAKMCLMWPVWHAAFPDAQWVIVRRKTDDIIESCIRCSFMRGRKDREGWRDWVQIHLECFGAMKAAGLDTREIWPHNAVRGDLSGLEDLTRALGLTWREADVRAFILPEAWQSKE